MASKFTHLHTHSHYSLLDGLTKIDELVARTKELGMDSVALTDHGVLYGAVEFYKAATKAKIRPILGVETYVAPRDRFSKEPSEKYYHLILLAENDTGWHNLVRLVSAAHLEGFYYRPRVDKDLLAKYHEGLIALSACLGGEIGNCLLAGRYDEAKKCALGYQELFGKGNYFLEIQKHPNIPESERIEPLLVKLSHETGIPLVATQDSHYTHSEDAEYHDVLLAVQTGNKLSDDDRMTMKVDDFSILSPDAMAQKFANIRGGADALARTAEIAARCNVTLELGGVLLPDFPKPDGKTANAYLRELIKERLPKKIPAAEQTSEVNERLEYELGVIETTGFADYFLIVQDLIHWAKLHGIAVGPGRGSAAGSLVSYVLDITDLNPLKYNLLFERFLNPERIQMPDIDIDFADKRRDEVLAYAREKYGEDRVARIITFGTMAARAAIRDAGRAMGYSYAFCDQIAKLIPFNPTQGMKEGWLDECLKKVAELKALYDANPDAKKLIDTARHLEGVARHASVHACGTVIAKDILIERVPLQFAPQEKDIIITQFEMHAIEDLGLLKIDLLGLKNLTIIEDTIRLIKELTGTTINISQIPLDDPKTFTLLRKADTTGVFQFESSGMRRYMKEIKPTGFEDLIALVALFRPGPMELIPAFIKRKNGQERISYLHPKLAPILGNTYGVGVYQEQMMQIARDLAGYTLPEADTLRKAIGKKIKSLLDEQGVKLVRGMIANGIPEKTARAIWELFPPFARYGFNKSHAACYALIGYQTAYLKANYPEEFTAALLNAEVSDIERISFLIQEAKQSGITILPPDINKSFMSFTPEEEKIRFGLEAVKNVGTEIARAIIEERTRRGPFKNFEEVLTRIQHKDLNKKSLESLTKAGAFDSLGIERNQALQNMDDILKFANAARRGGNGASSGGSLFGDTMPVATLKLKPVAPATNAEKLTWEKELIGFYLSEHPLAAHGDRLKAAGVRPIAELALIKSDKIVVRTAGVVSKVKKIYTKSGQPMIFATIEDAAQTPLEIVVFNSVLEKTAASWVENATVVVQGRISPRDGETKMICDDVKRLS
ncbi:MAG TPA: DNA polymerase III subunit alpha [Candidatus Paceibacterota bacterium]|jgi:DNA polymerase-3 subunit alpha|nr:DNA polymerase III subunit alpha [Candidatus Paceibacterota bacterium]